MIAKGYIILKGDIPLKADNSQSLFKLGRRPARFRVPEFGNSPERLAMAGRYYSISSLYLCA